MSDHAMLRVLDSYFRHPLLHLLPILLFAGLGAWYLAAQDPSYRATGIVLVENETFLSSLTDVRASGFGRRQSPAQGTSVHLNALLQTDAFVGTVAEGAGWPDGDALRPADKQEIRQSIGSWATGEDLVQVWATHEEPRLAGDLATSTIDALIQWEIETEIGQSAAAEEFLGPLTQRYEQELRDAENALEQYLSENPVPDEAVRPPSQQVVLDGLTTVVTDARTRYAEVLEKQENAELASAQVQDDVRNRLQIVDAPGDPVVDQAGLKTMALTLAVFLTVGGLLSIASVVAGALTDRRIRLPHDLVHGLDTDLLAVIPEVPGWDAGDGRPRGRRGGSKRGSDSDDLDEMLRAMLGGSPEALQRGAGS